MSAPPMTGTAVATDGSGYTLNASGGGGNIIGADGKTLDLSGAATTATTDSNGNKVSQTTQNSQVITDTLGQTVLTISGTNPVALAYTAPNGNPAQYTINYSTYNVKTNFACSGVAEYTATNVLLISSIGLPDGTSYQFSYEPTPNNNGYITARLSQITLPTGGSIAYSYTGANDGTVCTDGSTLGLTRTVSPGGTWTYVRSNISGNQSTTTLTTPPDPANAGSVSNVTVINFSQDNNSSISTPNFFETQRQVYQGSNSPGNLLMTILKCYNGNFVACSSAQVTTPVSRVDTYKIFPNGTASLSEVLYNAYGLVTESKEYGYGVATGAAPSSTYLLRDVVTTYAALTNNIRNRPSSVIVKDGSTPQKIMSETTYGYDEYALQPATGTPQHVSVNGSRGNVTTISRAISWNTSTNAVSAWLTQHLKYYDTGNVYQSQGVNGQWTTFNYDTTAQGNTTKSCGNSFPTSITYPISAATGTNSTTWDCIGGVAVQATDANGNSSSVTYSDPYFWRPSAGQDPASNTTTLTYTAATQTTPAKVESRMLFNANNSIVEQLTTADPFGRTVLSQSQEGPSSANYDSNQIIYDALGRQYQTTMPCVAGAGVGCGTAAKTTVTYDALGRPAKVTDGGGGYISYTYAQNDTLQAGGPAPSGENLKQKQLEYDALGRLTSVCELTSLTGYGTCGQVNSRNGYWTTYTYDTTTISSLLYTRITVKQNAQAAAGSQQTRIYIYDLLGRLVSEQNPETNNVAVSYIFDSATGCTGTYTGDLVKVVDAKGNTICRQYDAMHRLTQLSYPSGPDSGSTPTKTFVYDTASYNGSAMSNAKGRLAEAYTGAVSSKVTDEFFSYSTRGELTDTWECTPHSGAGTGCASVANYYHVAAGYWANGAVASLSTNIAGLPTQTYAVDGMGRTSTVTAASGQNPVIGTSYSLSTSTYSVTFGSGDSDQFTTDQSTGRLTQYIFRVGGQNVTGTLAWNPIGSLATFSIANQLNSQDTQTCTYAHDDLARISSVGCVTGVTNRWNQSFTYDPFGNITKTVPGGGTGTIFQPTYSVSTNWITALPGITPTTDANGQLTYDGTHSYAWDAEGKMRSVDTTTLTHDALGRMVEKAVGSTYTQFVYGPIGNKLAIMNGQTLQKAFVPIPAAIAVYTSTGLSYYRHRDHLGNSRLASTPNRTMYSSTAYAPFGESYAQAGTSDVSFTSQDQDTIPGMHDFMFRKYNSAQGRWLSPDPSGLEAADASDPRSWNRYAYVRNDPMRMIDPLGLNCVWDDGSYDDSPDDGGANASDCKDQGGAWISSVTGPASYTPNGDLGFQSQEIQAGYVSSQVNASVAGSQTFGDYVAYGMLWARGIGPSRVDYAANDGATADMRGTRFVQQRTALYIQSGCPAWFDMSQSHFSAYAETLENQAISSAPGLDIPMNYTQAEVGGYSGSITTSGDVSTFTIDNTSGVSSFIGQSTWGPSVGLKRNSSDNAFGKNGPGHNIRQVFKWTEKGLCKGSGG